MDNYATDPRLSKEYVAGARGQGHLLSWLSLSCSTAALRACSMSPIPLPVPAPIRTKSSWCGLQHTPLVVRDIGVGFPDGVNVHQTTTLSLRLVYMLTEQRNGTIGVECQEGTAFILTFPMVTT
jgi:two-component sensor histidine kinase